MEIFSDPETATLQQAKLADLRKRRDGAAAREALENIRAACLKGENVMPAVVQAALVQATEGEITDVFRQQWGSWDPPLRP